MSSSSPAGEGEPLRLVAIWTALRRLAHLVFDALPLPAKIAGAAHLVFIAAGVFVLPTEDGLLRLAVLQIAVGVPFSVAFFAFLSLLFRGVPPVLRVVNSFGFVIYILLFAYWAHEGTMLDYAIIVEQSGQLAESPAAVRTLLAHASPAVRIVIGALIVVVLVVAFSTRLLCEVRNTRFSRGVLLTSAVVILVVFLTPAVFEHPVAFFVQTVSSEEISVGDAARWSDCPHFPLLKQPTAKLERNEKPPPRPHVFLVIMESFNADFVNIRHGGREVVPFFNSLIAEGAYVERFYSNGAQTIQGHIPVMTSMLPGLGGPFSTQKQMPRLRGLPAILRDNGYRTFFFSGGNDAFGHQRFMRHIGTDVVVTSETMGTSADLPDNRLFEYALSALDGDRDVAQGRRAVFAAIAPTQHHFPYEPPTGAPRLIEKQRLEPFERILNSVFASDAALRGFFRELERRDWARDRIVVVTGDHGASAGQRGAYNLSRFGPDEEIFRIPFVLIWKKRIAPTVIRDATFLQVDIAPTILDLLRIETANHFVGRSIVSEHREERPVFLTSGFGARSLGVVLWPWKFISYTRSRREHLYRIDVDPRESVDRIDTEEGMAKLGELKRAMPFFVEHERAVRKNCVWPGSR